MQDWMGRKTEEESRQEEEEKSLTGQHVHVGTVGDAENVGRDFITSLANVHLDDTVGVDGEALVRVDGHAEETGVGLLGRCFFVVVFRFE